MNGIHEVMGSIPISSTKSSQQLTGIVGTPGGAQATKRATKTGELLGLGLGGGYHGLGLGVLDRSHPDSLRGYVPGLLPLNCG